jgi:ribonuclease HI
MTTQVSVPTKNVLLYSSRGKKGHWSCRLEYGKFNKKLGGKISPRSKYRAALMAVICGLKALKYPCRVQIWTRNDYVFDRARRLLITRGERIDPFVDAVRQGTAEDGDLWSEFEELGKKHVLSIFK